MGYECVRHAGKAQACDQCKHVGVVLAPRAHCKKLDLRNNTWHGGPVHGAVLACGERYSPLGRYIRKNTKKYKHKQKHTSGKQAKNA